MKVIEIIFILLLLIPIAMLMRYFVTKLSAETPKQSGLSRDREKKPTIRGTFSRKKKKKKEPEPEPQEPQEQKKVSSYRDDPDFVPRPHKLDKRSERVPFADIADQPPRRKRKITERESFTYSPWDKR